MPQRPHQAEGCFHLHEAEKYLQEMPDCGRDKSRGLPERNGHHVSGLQRMPSYHVSRNISNRCPTVADVGQEDCPRGVFTTSHLKKFEKVKILMLLQSLG